MKKILLLSPSNPFYKGGVSIFVKNITHYISSNYEIDVVYPNTSNTFLQINKNTNYIGLKILNIPILNNLLFMLRLLFRVGKQNYDLIIDNTGYSFVFGKKYKKVIIAHGSHYENLKARKIKGIYSFFGWVAMFILTIYQKYGIIFSYKTIAISKKVKNELIENYNIKDSEKINIISNGTLYEYGEDEIHILLKKRLGNRVCFISTDHSWKGIGIIEKLAVSNPRIEFIICGYDYKPKQKNVNYIGLLNENELKDIMLLSDVFLLPSKYEGQSLAILDAMACGLPIITYKKSDPSIGTDIGYIVNSLEWKDYDFVIKEIFKDKHKREKISINNALLMKKYIWLNQGNQYLSLIKEILG
ncbi:hypothetical protein XF24_00892 [candidate division SR1 bacterium Aalborg_AAW-1]|nr:hypothetical protein XF24_00892 [candidate division SR1 bacterium Aalborg_AAW-1]